MGKYDNRAFGHPLEVVFRCFMEIELEVKFRIFVTTSFLKLRLMRPQVSKKHLQDPGCTCKR